MLFISNDTKIHDIIIFVYFQRVNPFDRVPNLPPHLADASVLIAGDSESSWSRLKR